MNPSASRPARALTLSLLASALLMAWSARPAHAQADAAKTGTSLERAQKAADAVFHWIKLNGERGANRQNPAPAPAPAPRKPVAVAAPRPAPAPSPAPTLATAATPAPAPAQVALASPTHVPDTAPAPVAAAAPSASAATSLAAAAEAVEPAPAEPDEPPEVPLKLLAKVEPVIPRQLQQQSFRNGFAQVRFNVAADGSVHRVEVIKASHTRLGMAAVDAVRQWRFAPIPQPRDAAVEIAFSNNDE